VGRFGHVLVAKLLIDARESGFAVFGGGSLPEEAESLIAHGAGDVGVGLSGKTQNLHGGSLGHKYSVADVPPHKYGRHREIDAGGRRGVGAGGEW
jgi:hypothetical protein